MTDGPPAGVDRAALERIIRRAAELQASERGLGETLTHEEVLALGKEVGIPDRYLHQALLEERTRVVASPTGAWERFAGPTAVTAQRVVAGERDAVTEALVTYLEQHELLRIQRRQPGRVSWEPMGGIQAAIRRSTAAIGAGQRAFMLDSAATVAATLSPLEDGYVHVLLQADMRRYRGQFVGGGAGLASAGVAFTTILVSLGAFLPVALLPLPLGFGLGYVVIRQYAPRLARVQLGLERALDHLEHSAIKPSHQLPPRQPGLLGMIAEEFRRGIKPS